ncbi:hypothetical protein CAC42_5191 [Sphaceloma murrayae]|uniref:Histone acetyltransferase ESA1 n=1 Tax=Sphaceloma murrayae TaxID=2082308 RepID=A0A2K1QUC9_9PEZI|nr:hypothetical protein CAC42_5191 [Sphaceloma murrayae]
MSINGSLVPSARDLIMVFPRLAQRAGAFAWYIPDQVDSLVSKMRQGGSVIAHATSANKSMATVTTSSASIFIQNTAVPEASVQANSTGLFSWVSSAVHFEGFRGFGGMFSYFGSRWALATFAVSIFLNRTHFYASSRQNLELRWRTRLLLYGLPIVLLLGEMLWVLQAMRCQTSPDYALFRYGDPDKNLAINFGGEGGFMHKLSSILLFWQDDAASCDAMSMSIKDGDKLSVLGSFSFVWPFFITICISQFVETLACALQGRQPAQDTGMTTFEHSLAFAECEAMISNALGLGVFNTSRDRPADASDSSGDQTLLTRSMILRRLNVPSEVLLISFISCVSHLSSAVLAVSGKRHKYRLVNTGIWALCYLSAFIWSFFRVMANPLGSDNDLGILRFPTVCIIGFIPHILIMIGISICAVIYSLALIVTMISLPPDAPANLTLRQRFSVAFDNLQANVQFSSSSSIKLNWSEDFYTNLLKVGFNILTAASEAVYLNEGSKIRIHDMTWLERKRLGELAESHREKLRVTIPNELTGGEIAPGLEYSDSNVTGGRSGYANERKSKSKKKGNTDGSGSDTALGMTQRRSRWELVVEFLNGVILLMTRIFARATAVSLAKLGVDYRPAWLMRHANLGTRNIKSRRHPGRASSLRDFWIIAEDGSLTLPKDSNVDVEQETRQRLLAMSSTASEDQVDDNLYQWWKGGGWWGDLDTSGDYAPLPTDDDLTSIISTSDASNMSSGWETDGQITPTEDDPFPSQSQAGNALNMSELSRLLDPKTAEEREEARILSRHLQNNGIMTRSQYRRRVNHDKAKILTLRRQGQSTSHVQIEAQVDEEQALEHFLLEQREKARVSSAQGRTWMSGADGMGAGGPQVGVKAMVEKEGEKRRAEILSIRTIRGNLSFYVHYEDFNKRLDEWVSHERIDLSQQVEWPLPEKPDAKTKKTAGKADKLDSSKTSKTSKAQKSNKRPRSATTTRDASATPTDASSKAGTRRPSLTGGKENRDPAVTILTPDVDGTPAPDDDGTVDLLDASESAAAAKAGPGENYSREEEIEKLRTGGSMTQNQTEISRVRNLERIQMGQHEIEPWYFSPYPSEFSDAEMVYICEMCLLYFDDGRQFRRHREKCTLLHPPGNEIYRDDYVSFFEIDGRRQRTWCRNLCLLSKLFLDHKTLYYDVDPFLFYCMTSRDEHGHHLVGYFSKEKESAEGYNVACILTLPQFQRKGYGRLLIAFSYELSKREGKLGSPEKPLSDLGLLGYRAFWLETIVALLMELEEQGRKDISVEEVGTLTAMTTADVLHTLQTANMLRYSQKNHHVIVLTNAVVEQRERQIEKEKLKGKRSIDAEKLVWKPPVFTASSRTWNW